MIHLNGKFAVVTGSARGIGKAIARKLAELGATVVISDVNGEAASSTVSEIQAAGGGALAIQADVSDPAQAEALIEGCVKQYGRIDILVNNAGITRDNIMIRLKKEHWDQVLSVNLTGPFLCTQIAFKYMMKQKGGAIVNIASIAGETGNFGQTNYSASKAGLIGFTKSVALEGASRNIRCNAVAPGFIKTDMTDALPEKIRDEILSRIPLGRIGSVEDVASGVAFLASDAAAYITGHVLDINGGVHM